MAVLPSGHRARSRRSLPVALAVGVLCLAAVVLGGPGRPGPTAAPLPPGLTAPGLGAQPAATAPPAATPAPAPAPVTVPPPAAPVSVPASPVAASAPLPRPLGGVGARGSQRFVVDAPGGPRQVLLHVPAALDRTQPAPLILVLGGLALPLSETEQATGLDGVGETNGAVVAYVGALHGSWDAGSCCGYAAAHHVDDVAALHAVTDALDGLVAIDRRRVVVAGFSNGAMLAYRIGCQESRGVAGVIVVAGALVAPCRPRVPVSLVVAHGLLDRTVPVDGQRGSAYLHAATPSVVASLSPFLRVDGCRDLRTIVRGRWSVELHRRCRGSSSVTVFRDALGAHAWPATVPGGSFAQVAYDQLVSLRSARDFGR